MESQPRHDVGSVDVVLHHRGEPRRRVLVGDDGRQAVAQIEEPSGFVRAVDVVEVDPAAHRPPVELATAYVHATLEVPRQQVGDRRLARRLRAGDQPHRTRHQNEPRPAG